MRIFFLENDDKYVVYFADSLKIFNVNRFTKDIIEKYNNGASKDEIIRESNISEEAFNKIENFVLKNSRFEMPEKTKKYIEESSKNNSMRKLILNVTNKCNMACKYCYANGGNYSSEIGIMSFETAKMAIDLFLKKYDYIETIMFFGGEPLLNLDVIEKVCEYMETLDVKKPQFGFITNGTIVNDKVIDIINRYNMGVTVSLDGMPKVNDKTRVYKNGKGVGEDVLANIQRLQKETKALGMIEVTYNHNHEIEDISVADVLKYIQDDLHIEKVHITPVSVKDNDILKVKDISTFYDAVDYSIKTGIKDGTIGYLHADEIVERIQNKLVSNKFCQAGINHFSVSVKGDIYPCFMLTDNKDWFMGNIKEDIEMFESDNFVDKMKIINGFDLSKIEKCRDCISFGICKGCMGDNYIKTGDAHVMKEEQCEWNRRMTERVIINIANESTKKVKN